MKGQIRPTLAVMAAGLGHKYGGLKQIDPVHGDHLKGYILLEYAIYDAVREGFGKVVILIRRDFENEFMQKYGDRIEKGSRKFNASIEYVYQPSVEEVKETYPFREKMWGTGHATLCFRNAIKEPFALINADDFYGRKSFKALYDFFNSDYYESNGNTHVLIGFPLRDVVSSHGTVSRAICAISSDGFLESIVEREKVVVDGGRILYLNKDGDHTLDPNAIVSTNLWGFNPTIFHELENDFKEFLMRIKKEHDPKKEYYLPNFVSKLLSETKIKVRVLQTNERYFGMTYKQEKPFVIDAIQKLINNRSYPNELWNIEELS